MAGLAAEGLDHTPLGAKLHDLALLLADLTNYTAGRFTDPDEYLALLAEHLPGSGLLQEAEVWVDSFSGFTPQELSVLAAVMKTARQVHVSLCLDPSELSRPKGWHRPTDLFHPTLATYDQVREIAQGLPLNPPLILPGRGQVAPRFRGAGELGFLESQFFHPESSRAWSDPVPALACVAAQNRRQEIEACAREVLRQVQAEGLRYREIAVVVRNFEGYADLIATVFAEHGIPAFLDRRRTVAHHPLVELLRSALEAVIQDWAYAPVFRFLKTDLVPVSRGEVDELENYVLEHGIRGSRWFDGQPWTYVRRYTLDEDEDRAEGQAARLQRVNVSKERATAALAALHRRLRPGRQARRPTVRQMTIALYQMLDQLAVADRLKAWGDAASAAGDLELAQEHVQVWDGVLALLDEMVDALGEAEMPLPQYLQVLSAGLDGLRLGLIPPGLDQVVVGSVERSRHSGVRAALLLGCTDRDFPPVPAEDVLFNDGERDRLQRAGLTLGPTSQDRLFQEQYFTYLALTRSSHRLWLSYPLADEEGRSVAPSPVLRRLRQLFPELQMQAAAAEVVSAMATPEQMAALMVRHLRLHRSGYPLDPLWWDLYEWAATDPTLRNRVSHILAALCYEESFARRTAPLGPALAADLFGTALVASVSQLESLAACPFQHFSGHGLRLRERAQFQVAAPELGLFYHAAMSRFVRRLAETGTGWDGLTPAEAAALLDVIIDELAPRLNSEILLSSQQHRYVLRVLRRTLQSSLRFLGEHVHQGSFRPLWVELPFGEAAAGLPYLEVPVPGRSSLRLRGRIDRVDGYRAPDGQWHVRVIDYKSSARSLDLGRFYYGLALQLILYLHAVVEHGPRLLGGPAAPAGALYFPVYDPLEPLTGPQPPEQVALLRRKRFRARGLVAANPEVVRWMDPAGSGLIQASLNRDGTLRRGAPIADPSQFSRLFAHLQQVLVGLANGVVAGDVAVAPVRLGGETPCRFCAFRSVCQFDPLVPGQGYRTLPRLRAQAVWELLEKGGEDDG